MEYLLYNVSPDLWISAGPAQENNTSFATQWIQCVYPVSGGYGVTPRYIYYVLIMFSIFARRISWLAKTSMATVMVYSSTAAIHAVVLLVVRVGFVIPDITDVVRIEGTSVSGIIDGTDSSVWLSVLPKVRDTDADPVQAIVITAFMVLLPMQIWSHTLRGARPKLVLWAWRGLLLIGCIGSLTANDLTNEIFPQLRFCPPDMHDKLPLLHGGSQTMGKARDDMDKYYWNRTIEAQYITKNSSVPLSSLCIYPCFSTSSPIRDPEDIMAVPGTSGALDDTITWLPIATYVFLCTSAVSSVTVYYITTTKLRIFNAFYLLHPEQEKFTAVELVRRLKATSTNPDIGTLHKMMELGFGVYFPFMYVLFLSPFALLAYVISIEFVIWREDPGGESFRHVGQWSAIIGLLLVVAAAFISHVINEPEDGPAAETDAGPGTEPVLTAV